MVEVVWRGFCISVYVIPEFPDSAFKYHIDSLKKYNTSPQSSQRTLRENYVADN
ncbi:MAG: hypothetical protein L0956_08040 [Candidatus Mariimomonas ferrooxydans]